MRIALLVLSCAFGLFIGLTLIGACILGTFMDRKLRGEQ